MIQLPFGQPLGGIMQIAFVVPDIHQALAHWTKNMKVGPFFLIEHIELLDKRYRGKPAEFDLTIALGFSGSMCVELIQQNDENPSVYRDTIKSRGYGFHHWAVSTEDFEAEIRRYEAMGAPEAFYARVAVGARAAYMDTTKMFGAFIELIEITPKVNDLFAGLKAAADGWDGSDPIRRP